MPDRARKAYNPLVSCRADAGGGNGSRCTPQRRGEARILPRGFFALISLPPLSLASSILHRNPGETRRCLPYHVAEAEFSLALWGEFLLK